MGINFLTTILSIKTDYVFTLNRWYKLSFTHLIEKSKYLHGYAILKLNFIACAIDSKYVF